MHNLPKSGKTNIVIAHVEDGVVLSHEDVSKDPQASANSVAEVVLKSSAASIVLGL